MCAKRGRIDGEAAAGEEDAAEAEAVIADEDDDEDEAGDDDAADAATVADEPALGDAVGPATPQPATRSPASARRIACPRAAVTGRRCRARS